MREHDDSLQDIVERFLTEKPTDVEAFLRAHPEHAAELHRILGTIDTLGEAARALGEEQPEQAGQSSIPSHSELPLHSPRSGDFVSAALARIEAHGYRAGRFRTEHEISRGGQGVVLAAWDETLQRRLAMKVARTPTNAQEDPPSSAVSLGRFLEEAQVTAQLDHPGIVPVHDLGLDTDGRVYFTMKLVRGRDLLAILDLVQRGEDGWNRTRALGLLLKVCEAMAYAHSKGVIHRDLKPSNVMVGKYGEVYVMDWGLARVLGKEDRKDVRIRPDPTEPARTEERGSMAELDSPLATMDGDVVGTPAFMSPEQARGELDAMGPHSDVYSVGAMLYQLLTGRMPYVPGGTRLSPRAVWALVQKGPPEPVHALAPGVSPELEAICDKAMAREVAERYPDMSELAEDLRAYVEHRVVRAHQTGAIVELRKWVERNKPLAAALAGAVLSLVAGLLVSLFLKGRSDANALRAANERADVLRLSALQKVQDLTTEAEGLWPAWPDKIEAYDDWLGRARAVVAELEPDPAKGTIGHRALLAKLEARALPYTEEERLADRESHPRVGELVTLRNKLEALRLAQGVRDGRVDLDADAPDAGMDQQEANLADIWSMVLPERTRFGDEVRGLALARKAVVAPAASAYRHAQNLEALAWAHLACGQDQAAVAALEEAIDAAPAEFKNVFSWWLERLRMDVQAAADGNLLTDLERELARMESEVFRRRTWSFASDADRWWRAQLERLVDQLEALADPEKGLIEGLSPEFGLGITRRRAWAAAVKELTVSGAEASRRWAQAIASISDRSECPEYRGLRLDPQLDLLPIGRDPRSGLWEFAHPLTGAVPLRDEEGELVLTEESGLVLVLVPGGTFTMGAQRQDPAGPNYDPQAQSDSPLREVTVEPFFLSKYEMTQGQWLRLTGINPSYYHVGGYFSVRITLLNPVEQVSWRDCMRVCRRIGMTLPNEAQWEFAARAGSTTAWGTGDSRDSLVGTTNLADRSAARFPDINWEGLQDWPELDDGNCFHAPVGRYVPNPFGLHDMSGNVMEWCRNAYDAVIIDPMTEPSTSRNPAIRGSCYQTTAFEARSGWRGYMSPESASHTLGLRPARDILGETRQAMGDR